ncbi:sensor histidine kinase [Frankia torreyi]
MLERAVTNLLDNAVKFSPPASVVRVRTRDGEVTVADDGPGIAPQERAQVFDRFYRATSARGLPGSGLGLAIVADAVKTHGGTVTAEGSPSGGALLRMRLPLATPDPSDPRDALTLAGGAPGTDADLVWRPPPAGASPTTGSPAPTPADGVSRPGLAAENPGP